MSGWLFLSQHRGKRPLLAQEQANISSIVLATRPLYHSTERLHPQCGVGLDRQDAIVFLVKAMFSRGSSENDRTTRQTLSKWSSKDVAKWLADRGLRNLSRTFHGIVSYLQIVTATSSFFAHEQDDLSSVSQTAVEPNASSL